MLFLEYCIIYSWYKYIKQNWGQLKYVTALWLAHLMKPETSQNRSSAVRGLHLWHAPEMRMAHAPSCYHHLHGLSCMFVKGRLSMWTPGLSWAPWAAGLLAGRGEVSHAALPPVFHPTLKRRDHLSIQALFLSVCSLLFFVFVFVCFVEPGEDPGASHAGQVPCHRATPQTFQCPFVFL